MPRAVLTKPRLEAIIDALTEALAGEIDGDRKAYEGALHWATNRMATRYYIKETQP